VVGGRSHLTPTGIFENLGARFLQLTREVGKRFSPGLIVLIAPVCAFLPMRRSLILLAPVIIRVAEALEIDFVAPMIFDGDHQHSAGLLTWWAILQLSWWERDGNELHRVPQPVALGDCCRW